MKADFRRVESRRKPSEPDKVRARRTTSESEESHLPERKEIQDTVIKEINEEIYVKRKSSIVF